MTEMCMLKHIAFILVSLVMGVLIAMVLWVNCFRICCSDLLLRGSECTLKSLRSLSKSAYLTFSTSEFPWLI